MKAFMLSWEFPSFISGDLGTACYGLTKAMCQQGMQIAFILPKAKISDYTGPVRILSAEGSIKTEETSEFENVSFHTIASSSIHWFR
jgi:glycogen(starch) synthase